MVLNTYIRDRLVDDRAFFAFSVDSLLYLRRKSCYRTSVPASFMIAFDTPVPWRWKNAREDRSRKLLSQNRSLFLVYDLSRNIFPSFCPLSYLYSKILGRLSIAVIPCNYLIFSKQIEREFLRNSIIAVSFLRPWKVQRKFHSHRSNPVLYEKFDSQRCKDHRRWFKRRGHVSARKTSTY